MVSLVGDESAVADEQVRRQAIVFADSSGAGDLSRLEKAILNTIEKDEKKDSTQVTRGVVEQKVRLLTDAMGLEERADSLNSFRCCYMRCIYQFYLTLILYIYRDGSCQVLICSDLAARGLDIPNTSLVIQVRLCIMYCIIHI